MPDPLGAIADDHGVSSAREGYLRAALLQIGFFLGGVPLDHQVHGSAQTEVIKATFQEVVLRSAIYRLFGDILVFDAAEYQDRNVWSGGVQPFKGRDTSTVWQFDVYDDASNPALVDAVQAI